MKPWTRLSLIFLFLFSANAGFALEDTIVAIVNNDVVTVRDLHDFVSTRAMQMRTEGRSQAEIESALQELQANGLQILIEDKIVLTEANARKIEIPPILIDRKVAEIKAKYPSEDEFLNGLLSDGATVTDLRNRIQDQLKIKALIDDQVRAKIFVNPQEVNDYYKSHFEQFQKPERLKLDSIYVRKSKSSTDEARQKAHAALQQLKEGKDFLEVAKEFSDNPSIGTINKGEMLAVVEQQVFKLKEGEISAVIEIKDGFYIFKVWQKFPAEIATLEEAKNRIYDEIYFEKYRVKLRKWLDKLKEKAFIEIKNTL